MDHLADVDLAFEGGILRKGKGEEELSNAEPQQGYGRSQNRPERRVKDHTYEVQAAIGRGAKARGPFQEPHNQFSRWVPGQDDGWRVMAVEVADDTLIGRKSDKLPGEGGGLAEKIEQRGLLTVREKDTHTQRNVIYPSPNDTSKCSTGFSNLI